VSPLLSFAFTFTFTFKDSAGRKGNELQETGAAGSADDHQSAAGQERSAVHRCLEMQEWRRRYR
jgi:hypothetical protein